MATALRRRPDAETRANDGLTRRRFLQSALAAGSVAAIDPFSLFGSEAFAGPPLGAADRILVLIELDGGNDGLNTLVPYQTGRYYDFRNAAGLAIAPGTVLPVGDGLGLHPNLANLKAKWDSGDVAIVRGVGHPDIDQSHFSCMAKVMAGTQGSQPTFTGWVGRYLDGLGMDGLAGVSIADGGIPLLLSGANADVTGLPSWSGGLFGADRSQRYERTTYDRLTALGTQDVGKGPWGNEVAQTFRAAVLTAQQINPVYSPSLNGNFPLTRSVTLAARLINLDLGARVIHVRLGGFDTHNAQIDDHAELMADLDRAIGAFYDTVLPQFRSRVVLATFSEFGRRVQPNSSRGTDHGAANMLFVIGDRVKGGMYGQQPSLTTLDPRGNLQYSTDMRSVFATLLATWLRADDQQIFGTNFPKIDLIDPGPSCAPALSHNIAPSVSFTAVPPVRILDTRTGNGAVKGKMAARGALDLQVTGRGTVPASGVGAVVLNVTVTNPTEVGYLTVWPTGVARPDSSNLNFSPGQTVPNLVVAKVGAGGKISVFNSSGTTDVLADVMGWFPSTNAFTPLTPARVLDTRLGNGAPRAKLAAKSTTKVQVVGRGGVPASGVDAVVLNVTAVEPDAVSYLTVWPSGAARPDASSLNTRPGLTVPNLVMARVGADGTVSIYNDAGTVHVLADVMGWFPTQSGFHSLTPARILDTRRNVGIGGKLGTRRVVDLSALCRGAVPVNAAAVAINVTVAEPDRGGYLTVWPSGSPRPEASNLNFLPGQVVPNLVVCKLGLDGQVSFYNDAGTAHVIADVVGWFE
jgi:uncharacterized protein (DUF1501 family)